MFFILRPRENMPYVEFVDTCRVIPLESFLIYTRLDDCSFLPRVLSGKILIITR